MNIIFLDVQGVLTSKWYRNEQNRNLNPRKIKLLKKLIDKTTAKIVLTSSWRKFKDEKDKNNCYQVLKKNLKKYNIEIYDTIAKTSKDIGKENDKRYLSRSGKVHHYIETNKIKNYIIFDDRDQKWLEFNLKDHFIKTKNTRGLSRKDIKRAIKIINNKNIENN